ncbi:hypothetical protein AGOR_G00249490 [Albula goreensis]|uniref:TRAF-type domain-containing protein n=1 Tax=Albula goreensis TaxID=1534307 RepID=A0A8T3CBP6_9TELE|nr:hypothetical protein AGOR_G00249490 [Albula goreensis]
MCEYSSHLCSNTGCKEVVNLEDMDTHLKGSCGYRAVGVCQRGCGLVLPHKELVQGNHCCLSALRAQNGALQVKSARLEQAAKKERLEFGVREQFLLAQVSALQNEARLTALNYQKKLRQYMVHINNITKQLLAGHNKGEYDQPLSITLQEVEDSLDFKISSGQQGLEATGVDMSHLSERGPVALRDGPQVHDRILEALPPGNGEFGYCRPVWTVTFERVRVSGDVETVAIVLGVSAFLNGLKVERSDFTRRAHPSSIVGAPA